MSVKARLKDNPVRTYGGVTGAVASFITSVGAWGIEALELPVKVATSTNGLLLIVAALLGQWVGKTVQKHFTEPKGVIDEVVAKTQGEESNATPYQKARANDDSDHLPEGM